MAKKQNEGEWRRLIQEPTVRVADSKTVHEAVEYEHPAFGAIHANRITGGAMLYGSDFQHNAFVRISIATSILRRHLSTDWPSPSFRPFVEVDLSEAQWAHFVSAMNVGAGTQCTIASREGQTVPGLPRPESRVDQFAGESAKRMERAQERLDELAEAIKASGLSNVKQKALLDKVNHASMDIGTNQKFVAEMFSEHMETTVEAAKIEVGAYLNGAVRQLGIEALQRAGIEPLSLEFPERAPRAIESTSTQERQQ